MIALISLGSNVGNRKFYIDRAIERIKVISKKLKKSSLIKTEPWGVREQREFLNQVILADIHIPPFELLKILKFIEKNLGRSPSKKWGPREIDLDLLIYGRFKITREELKLPHPQINEREFIIRLIRDLRPYEAL